MKKILKLIVPDSILETRIRKGIKRQLEQWHYDGCPFPPPHIVKQITIAYYQKKYSISTLIETGTYIGDMIEAQKKRFKRIFTIELSSVLYEKAKSRFAYDKNIVLLHGNSGQVLPNLLKEINEPAIFWLDGHYSGGITAKGTKDCPILEELKAIFENSKFENVLLIDDARLFIDKADYPSIGKLNDYIRSKNKSYEMEIKNDIIR
jgi:hypothetical protein